MIALALKNTILMALIILILHFAIKNNMIERQMGSGAVINETYCPRPPEPADVREAILRNELKRFVFEDDDNEEACEWEAPAAHMEAQVCDPLPTCEQPSAPPLECAALQPPPLTACDYEISCSNAFDSCYGSWN
jgi:hypothetical protein